ncbi:Fic family protein [Candidatus Woesearchaeota archaeon]|nr:Fic family protein [Candidatus Woesearchaeota archaeon]
MIEEFREINKKFDKGVIINIGSLEFAISAAKKSKNWQEQLAFIVRAVVNDHVFADGNKRTAAAYIMAVLEERKLPYDAYKVDKLVLSIAKNRIRSYKRTHGMIKNAIC